MSNDGSRANAGSRKCNFFRIGVQYKDERHHFRLPLPPVALFALHDLFLSLTPLFSLFAGKFGHYARAALDSASALLLGFMACGPDEFANIDLRDGDHFVKVRIRSF